jgi:type IV pilus assembly protein PilA
MKKTLQKGFTLIELMIVVAIIGILAAVAIPAYQDYIARSQMSEAVSLLGSAKTPLAEFYADRGLWPAAIDDVMGNTQGRYTQSIAIVGTPITTAPGSITLEAAMKAAGVNAAITTMTVKLYTTDGGKNWICLPGDTAPAMTPKFLPASCRA